MQCSVCRRTLRPSDKPRLYDVHDVSPGGELGTGFRVALCPPSLEDSQCEERFRMLAENRGLTMAPVKKDER